MVKITENKELLRTVARALKVLSFFNEQRTNCTLHEISEQLSMPKSMVFRTLETLEAMGYIRKNNQDKSYSLGFEVFRLGKVVESKYSLSQIAYSVMQELSEITQETICLVVPDISQLRGVQILHVETKHPIKHDVQMSSVGGLHIGASRKTLLAYLGEEVLNQVLERGLESQTSFTITDPHKLKQELETIRNQGYAISRAEAIADVYSIATPIFNNQGEVQGAIGIYFPEYRLGDLHSEDELVKLLKQHSEKITAHLI